MCLGADLIAVETAADAAVSWHEKGEALKTTASEQRAEVLYRRCDGATGHPLCDAERD